MVYTDLYYEIQRVIKYHKNEYLQDDNPVFKSFSFDKQLFISGIDKKLVQLIQSVFDTLNTYKEEFLVDQADKIYFYKNVFALVVIVNSKYPNTGYSIKVDLNELQYKKQTSCLII